VIGNERCKWSKYSVIKVFAFLDADEHRRIRIKIKTNQRLSAFVSVLKNAVYLCYRVINMISQKFLSNWRRWFGKLLMALVVLLLVGGCGQKNKLSEFAGIVVAKRAPADILVVPGVEGTAVQTMTEAELVALAVAQNGVYFAIDDAAFAEMALGSKVVVHYDENDGEEVTTPPRRHSRSVEVVTE
jgi:hypothetical protein